LSAKLELRARMLYELLAGGKSEVHCLSANIFEFNNAF
jgi:hypothetical protein